MVERTYYFSHHLLTPIMHISQKLESEADVGFDPTGLSIGWRHPKHQLTCCATTPAPADFIKSDCRAHVCDRQRCVSGAAPWSCCTDEDKVAGMADVQGQCKKLRKDRSMVM